jgi:hypothetical protein
MNLAAANFRGDQRNTLQGFVDLTFLDTGLTVKEVAVHESHGKQWVALPARPVVDTRTGVAERYRDSGKVKFVAVLRFESPEANDLFQREALAAIARLAAEHPPH